MAKSDFIVLHQVFQLQYLALFFVLLLNGKPFAVMPHGTLTEYQRKQHRLRKFVFRLPTYAFLKSANGIFVATMQELEQLPKYLKEKGLIVGLGIEPQDKQSISKLIPPRIFSLLYMGRLAKKKRLDIALRAFALAKKDSQIDMNFIVCGTGEVNEITELKELVESLGIEKVVDFRGWVDSTEKQSVFFESSCFILTSEDENFAIAAAEALSYGIPCILSANVALASLVAKYNAGVVFQEITPNEIAQAIIKISTGDREVCKRLSLLASSELDWDVVAKQWESAIKSLVRQ
jgi:glycosyltransferase involved in cell wall biosynthesis